MFPEAPLKPKEEKPELKKDKETETAESSKMKMAFVNVFVAVYSMLCSYIISFVTTFLFEIKLFGLGAIMKSSWISMSELN